MKLTEQFPKQIETLKNLFGGKYDDYTASRLDYLFEFSESKWHQNLTRYGSTVIDKVLVAEAPPWCPEGEPKYFYNQIKTPLHTSIWRGIIPDEQFPECQEDAFVKLAEKGFILIDSLPFAMSYKSVRNRLKYTNLVKECTPFWIQKFSNPLLQFSPNVKIGFAFKLNALAIIDALSCIKLGRDIKIELSKSMILADGSGYPKSKKINEHFCANL